MDKDEDINLSIEWDKINFNPSFAKLISPEIEGLQVYNKYQVEDKINVKANEGLVLTLNKNY